MFYMCQTTYLFNTELQIWSLQYIIFSKFDSKFWFCINVVIMVSFLYLLCLYLRNHIIKYFQPQFKNQIQTQYKIFKIKIKTIFTFSSPPLCSSYSHVYSTSKQKTLNQYEINVNNIHSPQSDRSKNKIISNCMIKYIYSHVIYLFTD